MHRMPEPSDVFSMPWWQWLTVPTAAAAIGVWALLVGRSGRSLTQAPRRELGFNLFTIAWAFALFIVGSMLSGEVLRSMVPAGTSVMQGSPTQVGVRMLVLQLLSLGPVAGLLVVLASRRAEGLRTLGLAGPVRVSDVVTTLCGLIVGLLMVSALLTLTAALGAAMGNPPPAMQHELLEVFQRAKAEPAGLALMLLGTVLLAPVLEELVYRGLLQTTLCEALRFEQRWAAVLLTAGLFGITHAAVATPHALPALVALGVLLGYTYERTRNLYVPIAIHAGFNAANIMVVLSQT